MLQLFPSISHLIHHSGPTEYLSLLTPSILCHDDFVKSLATAKKKLERIHEIV
jgi:hypothetical protein